MKCNRVIWFSLLCVSDSMSPIVVYPFTGCMHLSHKIVSKMTYNVSSGTLNPTISYHTILAACRERRHEPDFSFVRFSLAYISSFHWLLFRFLCCHLVVVIFGLRVPAKWVVRKTAFCTSQMIGWKDHLQNYLCCVEWDINRYYTMPYHTVWQHKITACQRLLAYREPVMMLIHHVTHMCRVCVLWMIFYTCLLYVTFYIPRHKSWWIIE